MNPNAERHLSHSIGGVENVVNQYITEAEIRRRLSEALKGKKDDLKKLVALADDERELVTKASSLKSKREHEELLNRWIEKVTFNMRRRGRLMTERQYSDLMAGIRLQEGSWCRYVGPERDETTVSGIVVRRPHGQRGHIIKVELEKGARILTFSPREAMEVVSAVPSQPQYVALQVREYTPGWLHLEREDIS